MKKGPKKGWLRDYSLLCFTSLYDINAPTARTARVLPRTLVRKARESYSYALKVMYNVHRVSRDSWSTLKNVPSVLFI